MTSAAVIIPWRDRGRDPLRAANARRVVDYWVGAVLPVHVVPDGRAGDAPFNRSAAYNYGTTLAGADIMIYAEADVLVPFEQVCEAIVEAAQRPGLVIPFTDYHYLSAADSEAVRGHHKEPQDCEPHYTMDGSVGCVNVLSKATLAAVGQWDELFEGNGYDDLAMVRAFEITCGPTRRVAGPVWHLHHLMGASGEHLTDQDWAANQANQNRYRLYLAARTPEQVRRLTAGGSGWAADAVRAATLTGDEA